ncbi:MAG: XkdX family protein [Lachnospiraceae bacterium]|nr:XkdX family protein [Lachnospiraceae bacterium]
MHSKHFDKIKYYYEKKFWTEKMVRDAVVKERITAEEYTEITGLEY